MYKNKVWNAETRAVIMCFLLLPIGIYIIWKQNLFSKTTRISLTSIIALILIIGIINKPSGVCKCAELYDVVTEKRRYGSGTQLMKDIFACERKFGLMTTWKSKCFCEKNEC